MGAPRQAFATAVSVGRLHIVAVAALGCFTFGWLLTGHYPWLVSIVCALDWFLVNLLNRVVDLKEDIDNGIAGTDFVARHRQAILYGGFALLGFSLVVVTPIVPWVLPFRLAYHLLGFAYNWRIVGDRRIKQLYFWKNTASATGFLLTVFCYPLAWSRGQLWFGISWPTVVATAVYFFLFELSYEVIYDLRDAPGDARAEVRTYPVVHGERSATRIIDGLCLASLVVLGGAYAAHVVPWRIAILGVGPLLQIFIYKYFVKRGITSRDCINLTWLGAALLLAYHGWVLAGLPRSHLMLALELACAAIVAVYVLARRDAVPALLLLAVAGFLGEDSVIRVYGFYFYSPRWHLFLDRVPLLIVVIWPIVIHSAWSLGRRLAPRGWAPLVGAAIVLADASLIEPIAVHAGLWTWTAPGLFDVPLIGILGWAYFAGVAMVCLEHARPVAAVVAAPLATHVLLVASWWTAFKWLSRPLPPWPFVAAAWAVLLGLALVAVRRRPGRGAPDFRKDLLLRGPGAAFFFVLLILYGRDAPALCAYSVAFVAPYLALLLG